MNTREFKYRIRNKLLQIESAKPVNGNEDEIQMRCQFCGDSQKDPNKRRLYIKVNLNDNLPIVYNCFNCGESGILTPSVLRGFDIHDLNLSSELTGFNKHAVKTFNKEFNIKDNSFKFIIPRPKNTAINKKKKEYIEKRLGINVTVDELLNLKTIFSLFDFLKENYIDTINIKPEVYAKVLENNYVGFLTAKNEFINFRDITNKFTLRYNKYSIYKNLDNTRKFYTIPNKIDLLTANEIHINIAEGIFDILGVYYHIKDKNLNNQVYVAICGSAYINVVMYFIKLGFIGDNIIINIYSDSDKPSEFYKVLCDKIKPWIGKINLYYNTKSKDFGVPKNKIELIKSKI